jgi:hypothetical protein
MLTIHRDFSGIAKEPVFYIAENGKITKLLGAKSLKWAEKLKKGTELLSTAACSTDALLVKLAGRGVKIYTAHWHNAGIDKGLKPEEIAAAFSLLSQDKLRPFVGRPDLVNLRHRIAARDAVIRYRVSICNFFDSIPRMLGVTETKLPKWFIKQRDEAIGDGRSKEEKLIEPNAERDVIKEAKKTTECELFNHVFGMKNGWITGAGFVSRIGDISRFPTVASFWHYCGFHVVNGKAPKRAKGAACDWNGQARRILWQVVDSGLKNTTPSDAPKVNEDGKPKVFRNGNPKIRGLYEAFLAQELAVHASKCKCSTIEGHSGARARRRVIKALLQEYYALAGGEGRPRAMAAAA